ncbi:tol-pal system-associated acyl-CoA thioesterase [Paracoccus sp. TK19116]|uniref:Tol-pal system-associated acyl-CoA thioesterase n=1 Tax=Paracoccus albicereus TaxID=2922394 RepID=A0ABT1MQQ8_9RHOB|nr:tol-pal system-associated acyl-CoA thioesterase [Paracoccus albicereus]MCQ0970541.1 tol-pal system-associated acyl-CoA thioesterase [Paracoccus albicereus]
MSHQIPIRVYYEDTDLAGIVYYANYFKFIERGRTDWLRDLGIDQSALKDQAGVVFAVRRVEADYLSPARFDDLLTVETDLAAMTPARIIVDQRVSRDGITLLSARVTIACLGPGGRPTRIPEAVRKAIA